MDDLNINSIISAPFETNEEEKMKLIIEEILGTVNPESISSTLEQVTTSTKEEGINSSYEGNMIAEEGINKLLASINVNTAVKEQLVMRVEPLKVANLYEHYLLQSRLCGVPIEVFLNAEEEHYEIPVQQSVKDATSLNRRVEIGETFEDYSQNFKLNNNEEHNESLREEEPLFQLGDDDNKIEEELLPIEQTHIDGFFTEVEENTEELESLDTADNEILFEEVDTEDSGDNAVEEETVPIIFEEETQEDNSTSAEDTLILPLEEPAKEPENNSDEILFQDEEIIKPNDDNSDLYEDDVTRLMSTLDVDVKPVPTLGTGISKTYSLEHIRPITGGTSEI